MNMFDSLFAPNIALNEQIAGQIFDILPDDGPLMLIIDTQGHCWPSNSDQFSNMNLTSSFLNELTANLDDGAEPLITQNNDCTIVAKQLTTPKTNCGYVLLVFSQNNPESAMINIDLIEILFEQTNLIAKLIEQNNQLYQLSAKQYNSALFSPAAAN